MKALIEKFTGAFGPAGSEESIRAVILEEIQPASGEYFTDSLGNLVISRGDLERKTILVAAHMDEIGVMVTYIEEEGFLRFTNIGGLRNETLLGSRVIFQNGTAGVIGLERLKEKRDPEIRDYYLDIGAADAGEARKLVKVGDTACFLAPFGLQGRRVMAKALDNRAGCAVLVAAMKKLPKELPLGVHFVFTVQEELGLRGAKPVSYRLKPDYGLAVDVTRVGDTPEPEYKMGVSLGKGPAIKVKDSSVICHPLIVQKLKAAAEKAGLPYQMEVLERGGTDAGAIHLSREGIPSGVLSIPCRYIHSPSEMADLGDMENAATLLSALFQEPWEL